MSARRIRGSLFPGLLFEPRVFEEAMTYAQQIRWLKNKSDEQDARLKRLEDAVFPDGVDD